MRMRLLALILSLLCLWGMPAIAEEGDFAEFIAYAQAYPIGSTIALVGDEPVLTYYAEGYDGTSVFPYNSCTKSVMSCLMGMLWDQGLLDLETPIAEYFPQLVDDPDKSQITVAQVLSFTSGLEWLELTAWNGGFGGMLEADSWVDFVLEQPMVTEPGVTFNYHTGGSHLLSAIFTQIAGVPAEAYAREHLFEPLGMTDVHWFSDPEGITSGGFGIQMTTGDALRFGSLYLHGGKVGEEQIISQAWIDLSTATHSEGMTAFGKYGYQWWTRTFYTEPPVDSYFAMGYAGQYIVVIPALDAVIVVNADYPGYRSDAPLNVLGRYVVPVIAEMQQGEAAQ